MKSQSREVANSATYVSINDEVLQSRIAEAVEHALMRGVDPASAAASQLHQQNHALYRALSSSLKGLADKLAAVLEYRCSTLVMLASGQFFSYGRALYVGEVTHEGAHAAHHFVHEGAHHLLSKSSSHWQLVNCFSYVAPVASIAAGIFTVYKNHQVVHQAEKIIGHLGECYDANMRSSIFKFIAYSLFNHYQKLVERGYPQCPRIRANIIAGKAANDVWLQVFMTQALLSLERIEKKEAQPANEFALVWFKDIQCQFEQLGELIMPSDILPMYSKEYISEELRVVLEVKSILEGSFEGEAIKINTENAKLREGVGAITPFLVEVRDVLLKDRNKSATTHGFWMGFCFFGPKGLDGLRELHAKLVKVLEFTTAEDRKSSIADHCRELIDCLVMEYLRSVYSNTQIDKYHDGFSKVHKKYDCVLPRKDIVRDESGKKILVKQMDSSHALAQLERVEKERDKLAEDKKNLTEENKKLIKDNKFYKEKIDQNGQDIQDIKAMLLSRQSQNAHGLFNRSSNDEEIASTSRVKQSGPKG